LLPINAILDLGLFDKKFATDCASNSNFLKVTALPDDSIIAVLSEIDKISPKFLIG
jgi:hypothetical protein